MDAEMQFGDLSEEQPREMRRPDEDPHFLVVSCGEVVESDLRIYADLDCLLDMEAHALSNPVVELGGVMLGGQYTDSAGRAFVVVHDSLRAEHYESTRGSFKFTHDTWSQITRRLEAYPAEVRMVGWYHTHPDWGVFLSGMDLFICENFFNKPLDLALVIDPCRQDRGWFQWTGTAKQNPRRTGGFYLYSSRFREAELAYHAQKLEGSSTMATPIRTNASTGGGFGAPVVNVISDHSPWPLVAILGMITLQSMLVALLVWQSLRGTSEDKIIALLKQQRMETEYAARRQTLDDVAQQLAGTKEGFVQSFEHRENDVKNLKTQLDILTRSEQTNQALLAKQEEEMAAVTKERNKYQDRLKEFESELAKTKNSLREATQESREQEAATGTNRSVPPATVLGLCLAVTLLIAVTLWLGRPRSPLLGFVEEPPRDHPPESSFTQEGSKKSAAETNTERG